MLFDFMPGNIDLRNKVRELRESFRRLEDQTNLIAEELKERARDELIPLVDRQLKSLQQGQDWDYSLGEPRIFINPSTYEQLTDRTLKELPLFPNTLAVGIPLSFSNAGSTVKSMSAYSELNGQIRPHVQECLEEFARLYLLDDAHLTADGLDPEYF